MLQQLREKGWADSDIADALGVSRVTVFRWRKGQEPENVVMLSQSLRRLLRRTGPPRRKDLAGTSPARSALPDERTYLSAGSSF
jgi:transcriptional regulator with XRE-family HTH domain